MPNQLRTLSFAVLLAVLQMACSYTPVYDSRGQSQTTAPDISEQSIPPLQDNGTVDDMRNEIPEEPARVAVVSPDAIRHKPSTSNKDIAAARLRTQAADAFAKGSASKAEQLLNRALRISPRSPETYYQLATVKLEQGVSGQALQLARKGLSLCDPESPLAAQLHTLVLEANTP